MKLVKIGEFYVNPDKVVYAKAVMPGGMSCTRVYLTGSYQYDRYIDVDEHLDKVAALLDPTRGDGQL